MADCVDAAVDPMKTSSRQLSLDPADRASCSDELIAGDDAVLPPRQVSDRPVDFTRC
jgi:hypothetical protein